MGDQMIYFLSENQQFNTSIPCQDYSIQQLYQFTVKLLNDNDDFYLKIGDYALRINDQRTLSQIGYQPNTYIQIFYPDKIQIQIKIDDKLYGQPMSLSSTLFMSEVFEQLQQKLQHQPINNFRFYPYIEMITGINSIKNIDWSQNHQLYQYAQNQQQISLNYKTYNQAAQNFNSSTLILKNFVLYLDKDNQTIFYKSLPPYKISGYVLQANAKSYSEISINWDNTDWKDWGENLKYHEFQENNQIGFIICWGGQQYNVVQIQKLG